MSAAHNDSAIRRNMERVAPEVVQAARHYASSILADVAGRRGGMDGRIRAMTPMTRFAGPAVTVEVRPGDNLLIHAAMTLVRPGDVLVIDGKGDLSSALIGSIMINACRRLGVSGIVVDGAVRDVEELAAIGVPVFAVGSNPNGPTKACPGRINAPIACGGVAVQPGDLIVADGDGVTVIDREAAASLLELAAAKVDEERQLVASILAPCEGPYAWQPGWLNGALQSAGLMDGSSECGQS
jgi:4-hydroxy-4-methyl-2-oxoglutarate aldolase